MRSELDRLVAPLGRPIDAGDQARPVDPLEVPADECVAGLRPVGRAVGQPEVPQGVLVPGVRLQEGVLVVGGRRDLAPVAVEDVLLRVDELPRVATAFLFSVYEAIGQSPLLNAQDVFASDQCFSRP